MAISRFPSRLFAFSLSLLLVSQVSQSQQLRGDDENDIQTPRLNSRWTRLTRAKRTPAQESIASSSNLLQPEATSTLATSAAVATIAECGAHHQCKNNGTCVENANTFTCACPKGFAGFYCELDIDECSLRPNVCQNGATCLNLPGSFQCQCVNGWTGHDCGQNVDDCSTAACEAGATCHDRVGYFYCECPPGKIGLLCQLDDGCHHNPCHNNATCTSSTVDGRATCECPKGFTGQHCELDIDECAAGSPCEHGGSCVNTPGSFKCECPRGFTGSRCEVNINECENNPCLNDGTCLDEKGGYKCICMPGFTGQRCQVDIDECASNPCQNGAICKDYVNAFRCLCQVGYWGEKCEFPLSLDINQSSRMNECDLNDCAAKRLNGVCDQECNTLNCSYDGGDCPPGPGNPWAKCPRYMACWLAFRNGKCDRECNTAECLYDGNDCLQPSSEDHPSSPSSNTRGGITNKKCDERLDSFCLKNYANGVCDLECNNAECGWDGADCEVSSSGDIMSTQAQGLLVIRVEPAIELNTGSVSRWDTELARLLRKISVATKTILKIQNFRQVEEGRGTEIELIADNRKCQSSCYNSTELIAKFLSALKSYTKDFDSSSIGALKLQDIQSVPEFAPTSSSASYLYFIVCGITICFCAIMVISLGNGKQRVKEKATVWFPEGFNQVLTSRNRDPTERKSNRGVSTLQALGGNFFRGIKRNERNISHNPNGFLSTDIDRCNNNSTPNDGGIYHEPYDQYDQYGDYNGTDGGTMVKTEEEPMTPPTIPVNPINMEGPHGLTPLMVASMGTRFSKEPLGLVSYGTTGEINGPADNNVTDLLHRGAQLNLANKMTGETALHLAARHGRVDAARGLLERCDSQDVNAQDSSGRTPLHAAIAADSMGVFELLIRCRGTDLNAQMHDGTTPLILAARIGAYSMLEELILNECEVTKSDLNGKTALHWAAATGNDDAIRRLLAVRETNKDAQDLAEETPLFLAAREGAKGAVEILLSHNANKDISDEMDRSPIQIAREKFHYDIVRLLEEHEPPTPRSISSMHHSSRQISPFTPAADSNSNSNGSSGPPPSYHSHTHSSGNRNNGRQAHKTALARSNSTKPLIAEANIIRNSLQNHCKSVMVFQIEDKEANEQQKGHTREVKTLGRRATKSTSSSHQAIQPSVHINHLGTMSANNVAMPATPNSLTNSLSPVSSSMMSPATANSLHHLNSPTKLTAPVNMNQIHRHTNNHQSNRIPLSYDECQPYWQNNNNPKMVNVNNNVIDQTQGLSGYDVPSLKNYLTPSPDSPFSVESSIASPPGAYVEQQYQNPNLANQKQAGAVFI